MTTNSERRPISDARREPVWAPTAPWTSASRESDHDSWRFDSGFWGPVCIVLFQLLMIGLLVESL